MPVKVRCPSCDKLLNAPDTARGKAVKCPGCQTRIKVPAGGESGGKRVPAMATAKEPTASGGSSGEFFANLDLSKAADSSANMCPRCGTDIPEEALECPNCGVDPSTGQLTEAAKRRASQKGPDPALYYPAAWKDSWAFVKTNMRMVIRTAIYGMISYGLAGFCLFMVFWSTRLPPKAFWFALFMLAMQIYPGWLWSLNVETIQLTMKKKNKFGKLNFDMFQNIALGIKTIIWTAIFTPIPFSFLMLPLAMIHMSMPVTKLAWQPWSMFPIFFRNFGPTLYWWIIRLALNSFLIAVLVGVAVVYGGSMYTYYQSLKEGEKMSQTAVWMTLGVLVFSGTVGLYIYSLTSLFEYRAMGLLGYYFRENLDLITFVEDKKYERKEIPRDAFGNPIKTKQEKIMGIVVPIVVLIILTIAGFMVYRTLFPPRAG